MKMRRLTPLAIALLGVGFTVASPAQAGVADSYTLTRIGLFGEAYTSSTGQQSSWFSDVNAAGQVAGRSDRYNGVSFAGQTAWLYNGSATQEIGLTGAGYTNSSTGYQYSNVSLLNAAGQVAGFSERYNGNISAGYRTWLYNGSTTQAIGLSGAGYANTNTGYQSSYINALNAVGQVAGYSERYNGSIFSGLSAWLYSGGTTQAIGLTGAGYTNTSSGYQHSQVSALNDAGQVAGTSQRYNGSTLTGYSAWLYSSGATQAIGLTGAGYTNSSTGYQFSQINALNAAGQVIGYAKRFNGSADAGSSAWIFSGGTTQAIGLTGAGYTNSSGVQDSFASALNAAGQVAGTSLRYSGNINMGQSAWLYGGGTTKIIGLSGAGYTRSDGIESNWIQSLNAAGQVLGGASRFLGASTSFMGNAAWFYDGSTTQAIGLTGAAYTRNDGYQLSQGSFLNAAGQAVGISQRYSGTSNTGQSAWFFDDELKQTFDLTFSVRNDGFALSAAGYLGDDGLVLGWFSKYSGATELGQRAFAWTSAGGMVELGSLVDGGLSADWSYLANAFRANGAGQIVGSGILAQGGTGVFLLTPVPEPEGYAMLLAGLGLIGLVIRRRKLA